MIKEYTPIKIRELPGPLPEGEELLWQGSPSSLETARRVLHLGAVTFYFALLMGWRIFSDIREAKDGLDIFLNSIPLLLAALLALSILGLLSWLIARTTVYSMTTHRLFMQIGVALPMTVNIPFNKIKSADVLQGTNKAGDIALSVENLRRPSYVHFWPHVRAWSFRNPQPAMRALEDVDEVAILFSKALHAAAGQPGRLSLQTQTRSKKGAVVVHTSIAATA